MANNRIVVQQGQTAGAIIGTYDIFGTNTGSETVTIFDGTTANFQGDFARGGDVIRIADVAGDFTVSLSGSNVVLTSASDGITVRVPIGTVGTRIVFENSAGQLTDERVLVFNGTNVLLGDQVVTSTASAVTGGDAGNNPTTTVLTAGQDVLTGGASADTYVAQNNNLNAGDILDGGAGNDRLRVFADQSLSVATYAGFELSNIETLEFTNDSNGLGKFDLSGATGLQTLVNINSDSPVAFNQLTAVANLRVENLTNSVASATTIQFQDQAVAGTADAVNVSLKNTDASKITIGSVADANGGVETVNVDVSGRASTVGQLDSDIATLGITGNKDLTITSALNPTIRTVAGANFTGAATLSVAGATGAVAIDLGSGADNVTGSSNADTINVRGGNNTVAAGEGNDVVTAGDGNNTISTAGGNDSVTVGNGNNNIDVAVGNNTVVAGNGNNTVAADGGDDLITVGNGNNTIEAGNGANNVTIGTGNNTVTSGTGNDVVLGGGGNNAVSTGDGNDNIVLGAGNDTINAGTGNDIVVAGDGANVVDAGTGNDSVVTGDGADQITIGNGNDSVSAGGGNDTIIGGANFNAPGSVALDADNNPILDADGNPTYVATGGDSISGGDGRDTLSIAAGSNDASFRFASSVEVLSLSTAGTTTLSSLAQAAGIEQIDAKNAGNDVVSAGSFTRGLTVNLTTGSDNVTTGSGSDVFNVTGLDNSDVLNAGKGVDTLNLDATTVLNNGNVTGFEQINLGSGRDEEGDNGHTYGLTLSDANAPNPNTTGTDPRAVLTIDGSTLAADTDGTDPLIAETLTVNAAAVTNYRLNVTGGAAADTITDGQLADTITAGAGNDTINLTAGDNVVDAGEGNDTITLGTGKDNVLGGAGNDVVITNGNLTADDTVAGGDGANELRTTANTDDAKFTNVTGFQTLSVAAGTTNTLAAEAQEAGIRTINLANGGATVNAADFTSAANLTVNGGTGNDVITTGAGADSVLGGDGNDTITTGDGNDYVAGGNGNDVVSTDAGDDRVLMGAGSDNLNLGSGNDVVTVTGAVDLGFSDVINGGTGDDEIVLDNTAQITADVNLNTVTGVETIRVANDADNAFITFQLGNVTTLTTITVDATAMTSANSKATTVTLGNVQTDSDFSFVVLGGGAKDILVKQNSGVSNNVVFNAGGGDDEVRMSSGQDLGSNTFFNGGAGTDSIVLLGGTVTDDSFVTVSSFERLAASNTGLTAQLGERALASGLTTIDADANNRNDNLVLDAKFTGPLAVTLGYGFDTFNAGASTAAITFNVIGSQMDGDFITGGKSANDVMNITADDEFAFLVNTTGVERFVVVENGDLPVGVFITNNTFTGVASNTIEVDATALNDTDTDLPEGYLFLDATGVSGTVKATGGTGDDIFLTGAGNDTIVAGDGNDYVDAQGGDNSINAGAGNNTVISQGGVDTVTAGDGNNTISVGAGNDSVTVGNGNNNVTAGDGNDAVTAGNGNNTISAGNGNDGVTAGDGANAVTLGAGNDTLVAGNGNNTVNAGTGDDVVTLGTGNNVVVAGDGADRVTVGSGANTITGGQGADLITLGTGANTVRFLQQTDSYGLAATRDTVVGFGSDDTITIEKNVLKAGVTSVNFVGDAKDSQEVQLGINATANDGKADAIYDTSTGRLLVDVNDDGVLDARDLAISFQNADGSNAAGGIFSNGKFSVVDSVAPTVGGIDLATASDSGSSNSDNLTNLASVTVRVAFDNTSVDGSAAIAGNTLSVFNPVNNTTVSRVLTSGDIANGYYDFTVALANPTAVAAGRVNGLVATLADADGNSTTSSLNVTFDNVVPVVSVGDFDGADVYLNDAEDNSVVISGTASVDAAGRTVSVSVSDGTNPAVTGAATVDNFGNWSTAGLNLSGLNNGTLTVSANVLDNAGNASPIATATTSHDKVLPTVTISDDEAATANIAGGDVVYTFTFSEAVTGFTADDVVVTNGSKGAFNAVSSTVYTLAVTPASNFEGNMTVAVAASAAFDVAGNPSVVATTSTQAVDTVRPTVQIAEQIMGDNRINDAEDSVVTVGGSSTNAVGRTVTVTFTRGAQTATATATVAADGTWATNTVDLNAAFGLSAELGDSVTVTANLSDAAGNAAVVDTATVSYDNNAPNTAFTYGSLEQETNVAPGSNKGDTVNDLVTNVNPADVTFTYDVALTTGDVLQAFLGGVWTNVPAANINTGTKTVTLVDAVLTAGTTTFDLRVVDAAGNIGPASPATVVTLDTTAPNVGGVTWTSVSEEANVAPGTNAGDTDATDGRTNQATVDVVFTYAGSDLGAGERFQYSVDGGSLWVDIAAGNVNAAANTVTVAGISATGSPTVQIRTIDAAGNETSSVSKAITYDATAPGMTAVTFVSVSEDSDDPTANNVTNQATATLTFSYTGTDLGTGERLQYTTDGGTTWLEGTFSVDAAKDTITLSGINVTGSPTIGLRAIDVAGNETASLGSKAIVYDNAVPAVTAVKYDNTTDTLTLTGTGFATNGNVVVDAAKIGWDVDGDGSVDFSLPNAAAGTTVTVVNDTTITLALTKTAAAGLEGLTSFAGQVEDKVVIDTNALIDNAGNQNAFTSRFINLDLDGTDDANNIFGGQLADTLDGGLGADTLTGRAGADVLNGGFGNDLLWGGADNDTIDAGDGDDTVVVIGTHGAGTYNATLSAQMGFAVTTDGSAGYSASGSKETITFGTGYDTLEIYGTVNLADLTLVDLPERVNMNSTLRLTTAQLNQLRVIDFQGNSSHTIVLTDQTSDANAVAAFKSWANGVGQNVLFSDGISGTTIVIDSGATDANSGTSYAGPSAISGLLGSLTDELVTVPVITSNFNVGVDTNTAIDAGLGLKASVTLQGTAPPNSTVSLATENQINNFEASNGASNDKLDFSDVTNKPTDGLEQGNSTFSGQLAPYQFETGVSNTGTQAIDGRIAIIKVGTDTSAQSTATILDMFVQGGGADTQLFSVGASKNGWLLVGADGTNKAYLYYVTDANGNAAIDSNEIYAVGTLNMVTGQDIDDFHVGNFIFA